MRICVLTDFFIPHYNGGGERRYYEILKRLAKKGHSIDLVCMRIKGVPDMEEIDGIKVHHIGPTIAQPPNRKKSDFIRFISAASGWLLSHKYDLVEANPWVSMIPVSLFGGIRGAKKIAIIHDLSSGAKDQWLDSSHAAEKIEKFLIRLPFHRIICVSSGIARRLEAEYNIKKERIRVIPNGVDLKLFDSIKQPEKEKRTIVYIGRIIPHKHVEDLVNAINIIKENRGDVRLKIIGGGQEVDKLVHLVGQLRLERNVRFFGSIDYQDLIREMKKSEVLVLPSTREGFGMVLVEAFACNVPCIAYRSDGVVDVIDDGKNGYLVEQRDIGKLAEKIRYLLDNKDVARKFARAGRIKTEKYFSWDLVSAEVEKFYKSILR